MAQIHNIAKNDHSETYCSAAFRNGPPSRFRRNIHSQLLNFITKRMPLYLFTTQQWKARAAFWYCTFQKKYLVPVLNHRFRVNFWCLTHYRGTMQVFTKRLTLLFTKTMAFIISHFTFQRNVLAFILALFRLDIPFICLYR